MIRVIVAILLGLLTGLWETAVAPFLSQPWGSFHPIIPISVLLLVASGRTRALAFALPAAAVLDAYMGFTFDLAFVRYAFIMFALELVMRQFLTNRSVYASLLLAILARLLDWATAGVTGWLGVLINATAYGWHLPVGALSVLAWDLVITALGFLVIARFTSRFRIHMGTTIGI